MKVNLHTPVEEAQIQIIPLIDVVFCILTFFLLAALQFTRQQAINVDLPKASTSTVPGVTSQSGSQIVTIDAVGNIYIEKQPVRRDELAQRLMQYLQANPNGILVLNASRTATYNDVIEILDLMRQVGGDRVSLGIIPAHLKHPPSHLIYRHLLISLLVLDKRLHQFRELIHQTILIPTSPSTPIKSPLDKALVLEFLQLCPTN